MTDYIAGCDISHYQSRPDFDQLVGDGIRYVIIKASQGMGVDPDYEWNVQQAVDRSLPWLAYAWLEPDDGDPVIEHFLAVAKNGIPALDWEQAGVSSATVERWMGLCEDELGRGGVVYHGKWPPAQLTPRIAQWPWWCAQYPGSPTAAPRVPLWDGTHPPDWSKECLMWQWTGNGRLPGIGGDIDLDRIACPWEAFQGWYKTGSLVMPSQQPLPPSTPPATAQRRVLALHSYGADVSFLQMRLNGAGVSPQLIIDGSFGRGTLAAVEQFQQSKGLIVDGVVGKATYAALGI